MGLYNTPIASLQKGKPTPDNECPIYDNKQSDGEVPLLLELSETGPVWPGVVAPDTVVSIGQTELKCVLMLNWIAWNGTDFEFETVYLCYTELFEKEQF